MTFPVGLQLTPGLYRRVLTKLDEKVLPFMSSPLVLADFLTQSYNIGMLCLWYGAHFLHSPTTLVCFVFSAHVVHSPTTLVCFVFGMALISYTVLQHWYALSLLLMFYTYNIGILCLYCQCFTQSYTIGTMVLCSSVLCYGCHQLTLFCNTCMLHPNYCDGDGHFV